MMVWYDLHDGKDLKKKTNKKYDKDRTYPSEIFVSELRSKSEWERFPPALSISSFQREYLKKKHIWVNLDGPVKQQGLEYQKEKN